MIQLGQDYCFITNNGLGLVVTPSRELFVARSGDHLHDLFLGEHAKLMTTENRTVAEMQRAKLHEMLDEWLDAELAK